jgi:hypothetical protein
MGDSSARGVVTLAILLTRGISVYVATAGRYEQSLAASLLSVNRVLRVSVGGGHKLAFRPTSLVTAAGRHGRNNVLA